MKEGKKVVIASNSTGSANGDKMKDSSPKTPTQIKAKRTFGRPVCLRRGAIQAQVT